MKATEFMEQIKGDANICIAVLDGPVDLTHPCFDKAKITQLETLVSGVAENGPAAYHGTHVASLIFGQRDGPIHGISPGCRGLIIPVFADRPNDSIAPCSQIDLAHAITQAVEQGAHVINISGGELVSSSEPHPLLDKAVRFCAENNVLIVAAAGNDGCQCLHVPASISSTLAVGAMDAQGLPLDFSNWGQAYQNNGILALGEKLLGAVPGGGVTTKSGTSFATPIVSGIVALLLSIQIQRGEKPDPHAVRKAILQSVHPCFPSEGLDCSRYLKGRLNIGGAYNLVTKKHQVVTDRNSLTQQVRGNVSKELVGIPKKLSFLGVQNAEFTTLSPEIAATSTQSSTLDAMKALENPDSIEPKSIDMKDKQTKNQIQENNMTEHIEGTCGCPKKKMEETNEINEQTNGITVSQILADEVQAAESTITDHEAVAQSVIPAQAPLTRSASRQSLVYALGTPGYDFGSEARRDAFIQSIESDEPGKSPVPFETKLLNLLKTNPEYAESLIWTLDIEGTPAYAIRPMGSFASATYKQLFEFLRDYKEIDENKNIERVSIPGVIEGNVKLLSGQIVPVIIPEMRGMYGWNKEELISQILKSLESENVNTEEVKREISDFLDRVYYECMNLGRVSSDRAMNFAGTNAYQALIVFSEVILNDQVLDKIETERSPVCRPDSDCWDVKLTFFNPKKRETEARRVFRYTIDVSDVVPVTVGEVRSWYVY